ncbi:hypothetical protein MHLP_04205 [Candidatus Mycoplasma haematolamae str. Purdue]|uniref:Uncharacterized protein n=1 Tax=Mycoplasma haematolamae (strain Purdue) TaxID=1212765 RepID=I7CGN4_MYCHA|nr:hypothetical protein MHLP_04205 [Candidatus Mycoplasma haematolamae str. Purdue]
MLVGGGTLAATGFTVDYGVKAVRGGVYSQYSIGKKYCHPTAKSTCLILGPIAQDSYMTTGVWFDTGSGGADYLGTDKITWLDGRQDMKKIMEVHPGLKDFVVKEIQKHKDCKNTDDGHKMSTVCSPTQH